MLLNKLNYLKNFYKNQQRFRILCKTNFICHRWCSFNRYYGTNRRSILDILRSFFSKLREKLFPLILRYMAFRESLVEKVLIRNTVISRMLLGWISVVMVYKYITQESLAKIPAEWFYIPFFFFGIFCMHEHHEYYLAVPFGTILRLEMSSVFFTRFYHTRTTLLQANFPKIVKRSVWWKSAASAAWESIEKYSRSAAVQTVAVGASGMAVWKYLDYRITLAEDKRHREALEAEDKRHREALEAEAKQRQLDRETDTKERQLDREAEYKRHREALEAEAKERQLDREVGNQKNAEGLPTPLESTNTIIDD